MGRKIGEGNPNGDIGFKKAIKGAAVAGPALAGAIGLLGKLIGKGK